RTASWSNAKDVTQATFVALWRRAAAGDLPALQQSTALPWLLGVADRESRGLYRSLLRRSRLQQRLESIAPEGQHVADHADLVAQRLDDERRMARVRAAVRVLPTHQRVVVELVVWSGLSVSETASTLAIPEGTVKSRLSRAKDRLGAQLGADPTTTTTSTSEDR
ncbi:MAG: RNA polymerase sigma factor, partial [Janthinobacterium lividum]